MLYEHRYLRYTNIGNYAIRRQVFTLYDYEHSLVFNLGYTDANTSISAIRTQVYNFMLYEHS